MGLKEINDARNADISFTIVELNSKKKIGIKPWKVKEEKELLFAIEVIENENDAKKEIIKFIRRCSDNVEMFDGLSNTEYIKLLTKLRQISKGNKIEYTYKCEKCGFELNSDLLIDKDFKFKEFESSIVKVSDRISFSLKEISFNKYDELIEKYSKTTEYNYNYIINSIDSLVYNGEVIESFNEEDLIVFIDSLTPDELKILSKAVDETASSVTVEKKLKCGVCKHENHVNFGDLYSFLAFVS